MSENFGRRILAIVLISFMIPIGLILVIFEMLGVGEYVYPILFPIFGVMGVVMLGVFGCIAIVFRSFSASGRTRTRYQQTPILTRGPDSSPSFRIPKNCPSCGAELKLSMVEWRDDLTIVCSNCFGDVRVTT